MLFTNPPLISEFLKHISEPILSSSLDHSSHDCGVTFSVSLAVVVIEQATDVAQVPLSHIHGSCGIEILLLIHCFSH